MTSRRSTRTVLAALAVTVMLPAAGASAVSVGGAAAPALQVRDEPTEQRLLLQVSPVGSGVSLRAAGVLPRAALLHRIEAVLRHADGSPAGGAWEADVTIACGGLATLLGRVGHASPRHDVPRPLGVAFAAGDSVHVHVRVAAADTGTLVLHVTVHYEPDDGSRSRMPVISVAAPPETAAGSAQEWQWRAPADGRLLAVTGLQVTTAGLLVLQDAESGAVLWQETVQPRTGPAFGAAPEAVRSGARVEAGRVYRLTLVPAVPGAAGVDSLEVRALIAVASRH
jgi:hypothetical protein